MAQGYGQNCPVARALDIVGDRWSLLILRDLFRFGPCRFQHLEQSLAGIAPTTLSARIKVLESHALIVGRLYQSHPPRLEYELTPKGRALRPVMKSLYKWGEAFA